MRREFTRLAIEDPEAIMKAVIGDPPRLYPAEAFLQVARGLPDGAGPAAFVRGFKQLRGEQSERGDAI